MAHTTQNASFGPVLFIVASHRYICSFNISLILVILLMDIKNSLMAQMTCFALFGPILLIVVICRYIHSFRISSIPVRWLVDIINTNNNKKTH